MINLLFFILGVALFCCTPSFSQKNEIYLLPGSEIAEYDQITGIHRLYRNVKFESQKNTVFCDSAIFNEKTKHIRSFGKVHIQKDDINIYCDSFDYQTKNQFAKLWGNVKARDSEYKISSDSMDYNLKSGMAQFKNSGTILSIVSDEKISSKRGYFFPKTKDFFFSGNVNYSKGSFLITTDTLQFNYAQQIAHFFGPTNIRTDSTLIFCNSGFYNITNEVGEINTNASIRKKGLFAQSDTIAYNSKTNSITCKGNSFYKNDSLDLQVSADFIYTSDSSTQSMARGNTVIEKVFEKDTIVFIADSVILLKDSLNSIDKIRGYSNVKIHHKDFVAIADSGMYSAVKKEFILKENPILWSQNSEFKANHFNLFLNDSTIDSLYMQDNASIIAEVDSLNQYFNQLYGNSMKVKFIESKIKQSYIEGNAQSIYFPEEKKKLDSLIETKRYGVNKLISSELFIYFEDDKIERISYLSQPEGMFTPISKMNKSDLYAEKFKISFEQRPIYSKPKSFQVIP